MLNGYAAKLKKEMLEGFDKGIKKMTTREQEQLARERKLKRCAEIEKLLDKFTSLSSNFNTNGPIEDILNDFMSVFQCQHRTHQASIVKFLLMFLQKYSTAPHDGRNEAAVLTCKVLLADKDILIPFI